MATTIIERQRDDKPRLKQDPRSALILDRRAVLRQALTGLGAYAVLAAGQTWLVGAGRAWAMSLDALTPHTAETLLRMTRTIYPHDFLGDVAYAAVVKDLDAEAAGFSDKSRLELLRDGVAQLDEATGERFIDLSEESRLAVLTPIADGEFFQAVRSKAVVSLYNQPQVWAAFGYEGPSYEQGGYLYNGFDDLSWLPQPPAEASPPVDQA